LGSQSCEASDRVLRDRRPALRVAYVCDARERSRCRRPGLSDHRAGSACDDRGPPAAAASKRSEARVRRPKPVAGITATKEPRSWAYDPTIVIERDVQDQKGNYIARAGQTVNPLNFVAVHQALVFVDGDDAAQMEWATSQYSDLKAKIILVNGSPTEEMTNRKRRFYFDQEGRLTGKLGIRHTPAVAVQNGRVLKLSEIKLKGIS
jgi:conjugal transfer pilus assembly protein TraW